jgi:hypothetical protein
MEKNGELCKEGTPNLPDKCESLEQIPEDLQKAASDTARDSLNQTKKKK